MKKSETAFGIARILTDFLATVCGLLLGYKLRFYGDFIPGIQLTFSRASVPPIDTYIRMSLIFAGFLILVFGIFGLYRLKNTDGPLKEVLRVIKYSPIWVLIMMSYFFILRETFFSRLVMGFGVIISILLICFIRLLLRKIETAFLGLGIGKRRVLLIGSNKISRTIAENLRFDPHYQIVGYTSEHGGKIQNLRFLGPLKSLKSIIKRCEIEEIILTTQKLGHFEDHQILNFCQLNRIEYRFVPDVLEVERSNFEISPLAGYPLIHLMPTPLDGWGRVIKRTVDIFASGISLLILSPIFLLIAIGIKLDSQGPVFFSRLEDGSPALRVGLAGRKFKFFKFRTMRDNSHHLRSELKSLSHRSGPLMKIKNDPRITRFGRLLRGSSIDELPNLWNVFKGDMSLIGPRPHLPEEVAEYAENHRFPLTVKPGITGLAQVNGRSDLDFEEEVRLDSFYIKHWSPLLDLKILFKTLVVVVKGKAAD